MWGYIVTHHTWLRYHRCHEAMRELRQAEGRRLWNDAGLIYRIILDHIGHMGLGFYLQMGHGSKNRTLNPTDLLEEPHGSIGSMCSWLILFAMWFGAIGFCWRMWWLQPTNLGLSPEEQRWVWTCFPVRGIWRNASEATCCTVYFARLRSFMIMDRIYVRINALNMPWWGSLAAK